MTTELVRELPMLVVLTNKDPPPYGSVEVAGPTDPIRDLTVEGGTAEEPTPPRVNTHTAFGASVINPPLTQPPEPLPTSVLSVPFPAVILIVAL